MNLPPRPWPAVVLILLVFALYGRVIDFEFVNYDDNAYFTENPRVTTGLTGQNVRWAFGIHGPSMWVPLTWLSHQAMVTCFGTGPAAHHALNLLLHAANTALLAALLHRLTSAPRRSFAVALLFAIHPIHVESVAWVTERKDVLSLFFCLLALLAYERHGRSEGWRWFPLVILCHSLAVMAKPLAVTLPCVMLLLDAWPLGRLHSWQRMLQEKIPLLLITGLACWLTILCQQAAGALGDSGQYPLGMRLANAATSYVTYLRRLFVPTDLAVVYPYPDEFPGMAVGWAVIVLLATTTGVLLLRRRVPAVTVGWLWFLGTLVPMIGIVQAGGSSMADRYGYFTFIGLYLALVWGIAALLGKRPSLRRPLVMGGVLWLTVLVLLSFRQIGFWKDSRHLFERAVAVTNAPYLAYNNLGLALQDGGRTEDAKQAFLASLKIRPRYTEARNNLGILLASNGRPLKARALLQQVVVEDPHHAIAWHNLGKVHAELGSPSQAEECFHRAIRLDPMFPGPRYDLGTLMIQLKEWDAAIKSLKPLVDLTPAHADGWVNLGFAHAGAGDSTAAENAYSHAVRLGSALGRRNLLQLWLDSGEFEKAHAFVERHPEPRLRLDLAHGLAAAQRLPEARYLLEDLLKDDPGDAAAHHQLGLLLGQQGDHAAAMRSFGRVLEIDPRHPNARRNFDQARRLADPPSSE